MMVPETTQETTPPTTNEAQKDTTLEQETKEKESTETTKEEKETKKNETTAVSKDITKESLLKNVVGLSYHTIDYKNKSYTIYYVVGGIILTILIAGGYFYVKKIKK